MKSKQIQLSDIFERTYKPGGEGYIGFTVYLDHDKFKNYHEYYNQQNRIEVKDRVEQLYNQYQLLMFGGIRRDKA